MPLVARCRIPAEFEGTNLRMVSHFGLLRDAEMLDKANIKAVFVCKTCACRLRTSMHDLVSVIIKAMPQCVCYAYCSVFRHDSSVRGPQVSHLGRKCWHLVFGDASRTPVTVNSCLPEIVWRNFVVGVAYAGLAYWRG